MNKGRSTHLLPLLYGMFLSSIKALLFLGRRILQWSLSILSADPRAAEIPLRPVCAQPAMQVTVVTAIIASTVVAAAEVMVLIVPATTSSP